MTAEIIPFPKKPVREPEISLLQLARALGRSRRWIQMGVNQPERIGRANPLPHRRLNNGRLRFTLSAVREWLDEREESA